MAGLIGFGIAPSLVTIVSGLLGGEGHLNIALAIVGVSVSLISVAGFWLAMKRAPVYGNLSERYGLTYQTGVMALVKESGDMSLEAGGRMEAIDVSPEMLTLVGIGELGEHRWPPNPVAFEVTFGEGPSNFIFHDNPTASSIGVADDVGTSSWSSIASPVTAFWARISTSAISPAAICRPS